MSGPRGWGDVVGNITNPDEFLQWVNENVVFNKVRKQFYAGFTAPGGRAVYVNTDGKIYPLDAADTTHMDKYVGVTQTECVTGRVATIVVGGVCIVVGSGWQTGISYYIGTNGILTSTVGDKLVGVGVDPNRIVVISSGGGGGSTPSEGIEEIDGGFANSIYLVDQNVDGGGA